MGTKERHDRDRHRIRQAILDAARELFIAEGYQNVSMRKIADRIEYSPAAIYSYFPAKDDIFFALAEEGFRILADQAQSGAQGLTDPLDRLRRGLWGFYLFSKSHPEYFELMFLDRSVPSGEVKPDPGVNGALQTLVPETCVQFVSWREGSTNGVSPG